MNDLLSLEDDILTKHLEVADTAMESETLSSRETVCADVILKTRCGGVYSESI